MVESVGSATRDGDLATVRLTVQDGCIADAAGAGPGVGELCRDVRGLTPLAAAAVACPPLAGDALHEALAPLVTAGADERRVAVAMSGGVDSAVALLHVRDAGCEPVGVTLRLWVDPAGPDADRACCSPQAVLAARAACHDLGFAHVTLDLREEFRRAVVRPFVRGYALGRTPNPCIRCNGSFRFAELTAFARRVGASRLATGHYARIVERDGRPLLARAADAAKDQSYMLARVDPDRLRRLWFPLGGQTKEATRAQARAAGLDAAGRAESQEACFLGGADYRAFLARHGLAPAEGPVVDEAGREVGRHAGFWTVTPGQRRGLGAATGAPLYALATDPATNTVVAGPRASLGRGRIEVGPGRLHVPVRRAEAKLRYRSPGTAATVLPRERGFHLELDEPAFGVAPGQAAVLYDEDVVVGAGLIAGAAE